MDILITTNKECIQSFNVTSYKTVGNYDIAVKQPTKYNHFFGIEERDSFMFYLGNQYESIEPEELLRIIQSAFENREYRYILDMDGEFVCGRIFKDDKKAIEILTDREGIIPLYYKRENGGWSITTDQEILFQDYDEKDINWRAVNDYLRFGCLIGCETLSVKVNRTRGGSYMSFQSDGTFYNNRLYKFHYDEVNSCKDENELISEVADKYKKAIEKRVRNRENDTCVFMSGGMDSRFLLAMANQSLQQRIPTYCFGQDYSEEVNVARMCAEVKGNPFKWIKVRPKDFVQNAATYEKMVCGSDMFPQSYIIDAVKEIDEECFVTGFCLDVYMGGTFLNEDAISSTGKLKDFLKDNLKVLKMNVFSKNELSELCANAQNKKVFEYDIESLLEEAEDYEEYSVSDAIQAFAIDNRDKNLVLLRELTPAKFMDCSYVSCDRDFLRAVSKIPVRLRLNHRFYHNLYKAVAADYAMIVYNNTTLPVLAPVEKWKEGAQIEAKRESQFETLMAEYNPSHEEKIYYPHYYSDFNGYSRYDEDWKALFERYLFAEDAFVTHKIFSMEKVKAFYKEHLNGEKNRRKELVYLTSLEVFFRNTLRSYGGVYEE